MSPFFSYYRRIFADAWRETLAFAKRRLLFGLLIGAVVSIASWQFGLVHQIPNVLIRGLTLLVGSYATVFLGAFIVKLVEAPVSLDKKSANQITELSAKIDAQKNKNELRARFVELMQEATKGKKTFVEKDPQKFRAQMPDELTRGRSPAAR